MILYTTHCPKCRVLENLMGRKGLKYTIEENVGVMMAKGMDSAPYLEVDGQLMDFKQALAWLREEENGGDCATCKI